MTARIRERLHGRVPAVAGLLGVVSVLLVVGAVRGVLPMGVLPRSGTLIELVPHLNAVVSLVAIVCIVAGVRAIRRGEVARHRRLMLSAFALFVAFLVLYLYKVGLAGTTDFAGPPAVYRYVYLPVLVVHMLLAIGSLPVLYYVLLLAYTRSVAELPDTPHPRIGRVAVWLWGASFALGIVVYLLLYVAY